MPDEITLILTLMPIAFLGSLVYGVTGFGAGLVTIPLATHFVPLPFALSVFALVDFTSALRIGLQNPKDAAKTEIARMLPFVLIGTVTGLSATCRSRLTSCGSHQTSSMRPGFLRPPRRC